MEKTLYLHAGTHKTATTALQGFLARNAHRLAQRVLYPATGRATMGAHHHFFSSIRIPPHPRFPPEKPFEAYMQELRDEARTSSRVLLSSEILSEKLDLDALVKLGDVADSVRVILYLRPQHAYIVSLYAELVKNTNWAHPLSEATHRIQADYLKLCSGWSRSFGEQNVIVRPFQASQFVGTSVFSDFLHIFGLPLTDAYLISKRAANRLPSRDAIEVKRAVNFLSLSQEHQRNLRKLLEMWPGACREQATATETWLTAKERTAIMKKYEPTNRRVAVEFLGREDGQLFFDDLSRLESTSPEEAYSGLSVHRIREISGYLRREDPELFTAIAKRLSEYQPSSLDARDAVQWLREGFG